MLVCSYIETLKCVHDNSLLSLLSGTCVYVMEYVSLVKTNQKYNSNTSTTRHLCHPTPLSSNTSTIQHLYNPTPLQSDTSTIQHLYNPTPLQSNTSTIQHLYNPTPLSSNISCNPAFSKIKPSYEAQSPHWTTVNVKCLIFALTLATMGYSFK